MPRKATTYSQAYGNAKAYANTFDIPEVGEFWKGSADQIYLMTDTGVQPLTQKITHNVTYERIGDRSSEESYAIYVNGKLHKELRNTAQSTAQGELMEIAKSFGKLGGGMWDEGGTVITGTGKGSAPSGEIDFYGKDNDKVKEITGKDLKDLPYYKNLSVIYEGLEALGLEKGGDKMSGESAKSFISDKQFAAPVEGVQEQELQPGDPGYDNAEDEIPAVPVEPTPTPETTETPATPETPSTIPQSAGVANNQMSIDSLLNKRTDLTQDEANFIEWLFGAKKDEYWKAKQQGSSFWADKVKSPASLISWMKSPMVIASVPKDAPYFTGETPAPEAPVVTPEAPDVPVTPEVPTYNTNEITRNLNEYINGRDYDPKYQKYIDAIEAQTGNRIDAEAMGNISNGTYNDLLTTAYETPDVPENESISTDLKYDKPIEQPQQIVTMALIPIPEVPGASYTDGGKSMIFYNNKVMTKQEFANLLTSEQKSLLGKEFQIIDTDISSSREPITQIPETQPAPAPPVAPVEPVTPVTPVAPVDPVTQVAPVEPVTQVAPVAKPEPVTPVAKAEPVTPVAPVAKVEPAAAASPSVVGQSVDLNPEIKTSVSTDITKKKEDGMGGNQVGGTFVAQKGQKVKNKSTGAVQTITVPSRFSSSAFEIVSETQGAPAGNAAQTDTKDLGQAGTGNQEPTQNPLGGDRVDYLFNLYLGRPANENEKLMYGGHLDDTVLIRDLSTAQAQAEKLQQQTTQAKADEKQSFADQWSDAETARYVVPGDVFLVKFTDDPTPSDNSSDASTVFLYDKKNKNYIPFTSITAMEAYFDKSFDELKDSIIPAPTNIINNEAWSGTFKPASMGIDDSGNILETGSKDLPAGTDVPVNEEIDIYGQTKQDSSVEKAASNMIGSVFTTLKSAGGISEATFNSFIKNPTELAKYASALLYGSYTLEDVYRDIKVRELAASGNEAYKDMRGIDPSLTADQYYNTDSYKQLLSDASLQIPTEMGGLSSDLFKYKMFEIPSEAFSTIVKPIDINSPEFKEEADKIQAAWYDISMQQATANTEQAKAIADNNWKTFQTNINKKYKILLSDNSNTAWGQLQELFTGASQRGLKGSGLYAEVMDKYLGDVRKGDQRAREQKITDVELEQRNKLLESGTPEEIAEFIASNPDKAKEWGLIPSDETKDYFSIANLKSVYPDMNDDEIKLVHDMVIDDNGNYRSTLYQNLYTNKYNLSEEKKAYQQQKLYDQKLVEEKKAYAPYTSDNPFSSYAPDYATDETPKPEDTSATEAPVSGWVDPATGNATPVGVGQLKTDYDADKAAPTAEKIVAKTPSINTPSSSASGTNTLKAYNQSGGVVYVTPGKYYPGISLTPPAGATPKINVTPPASLKTSLTPSSSASGTNTLKAYNQSGGVVYVTPGKYYPGISLTPPVKTTTTKPTTPYTPPKTTTPTPITGSTSGVPSMVTVKDSQTGLELKMNKDAAGKYTNDPRWSII